MPMSDINELVENIATRLQQTIEQDDRKQSKKEGSSNHDSCMGSDSPQAICPAQFQHMIERQTHLEDQMTALEDELSAVILASAPQFRKTLHTLGIAFLLSPPFFIAGWVLATLIQSLGGSWHMYESLLIASMICIILGLLMLLLSHYITASPLKDWDKWIPAD